MDSESTVSPLVEVLWLKQAWQWQMAEVQMMAAVLPAVARLAMEVISLGPTLEKMLSYWQRYPRFWPEATATFTWLL